MIMKIRLAHSFEKIIGVENLLEAWKEFSRGKRNKKDVCEFSLNLMDNIFSLHRDLFNHSYKHGCYQAFKINDPKPRDIHKASVRDRLLHHAIYRILYPFFAKTFIADSYSCQIGKGTHRALNRFREFSRIVGKNNMRTGWVLKGDVKKFFASIDQEILLGILKQYIPDENTIWLLERVVKSFSSIAPNKGLPLGNLTSQLFVNIYMNKFDQFIKHKLKIKYYIRYADDFVIFYQNRGWLEKKIPIITEFLSMDLQLKLHPDKVFIKSLYSGVDFLGWVHFPDHRVLRTTTKKRMMRRLRENESEAALNSYLGLLKHGNAHKIAEEVMGMAISI
ncbi:MAG: Retron-type reverse transcriptase [Parcubacteria group bacterium GW2011_GWC1_43_12]|nr:MAG: Retron-type reverse transcriptase [Parcubacteria group bacterium GW2011_GWB1_42_6]KKS91890.1 MAG: Retron-type reverse transcriptase [Parcubacteria group bacterium GW2011_GWC1_43_12]